MSWRNEFVKKVPILTASPEEAAAIVRDTGYVTTHPFQSSLVPTLTDCGISLTFDRIVGVEYASHMMVPSATKTMRFNGLSQIIWMNNQGSQWKMDIFQRVKIMSMHSDKGFTVCKNSRMTTRNHTVVADPSHKKCFTQSHNKGAHPRYHNNLHLQPLKNYYA